MDALRSYDELRTNPPTPEEVVSMPIDQRNRLLSLSNDTLNSIYKGFLSGDRLRKHYDEKLWMPSPELMNAALFAGQGDFNGLQEYTYEHIKNLEITLKDPDTNELVTQPVPSKNIYKSLGIVERLGKGKNRRTGEPVVSHIYRSSLRSQNMMNYFNEIHNRYNTHTRFTPELAEIEQIVTILHDFEEDKILRDNTLETGVAKLLPNGSFFLRRLEINKRGRKNIREDLQLNLPQQYLPYLNNALYALNSSEIPQEEIVSHILGVVNTQYAALKNDISTNFCDYVLSGIPLRVKTAADRPDNLSTYFTVHKPGNIDEPVPLEKIITKSLENLNMFDIAELYLSLDNPQAFTQLQESTDSEYLYSPCDLPFSNRRWAVLAMLGLSPNQMYKIPEDGGLPELI